jgi:leucyl/phenylalanyl-tRNA--protein transferase
VIDPALLVHAYQQGVFPMGMEDGTIGWFSPDPRGIIPLETFHVPQRLQRLVRSDRFTTTINQDFVGVMRACAADREDGTWMTDELLAAYVALHHQGLAHSVEVWRAGVLVGGLYGVHLGGAFFGESMFHRETDASKVALVVLVERMRAQGFILLDIQWVTPHLARFGAVEVSRKQYLVRLANALAEVCCFAQSTGG